MKTFELPHVLQTRNQHIVIALIHALSTDTRRRRSTSRRSVGGGLCERVLPLFEAEALNDDRACDGIERTRAYGRGELHAAGEIKRRLLAGRAAQSVTSPAAIAAARAAGQASAVAHMGAHALGAAAYAAKAASLAADDQETGRHNEVRWQLDHMTPATRIALALLPLLGEDTSGPLGAGLLSSGVLAQTIREIQADLTAAR